VSDTPDYARSERAAYCDLVAELGPDQPTLCTGWRTRDLTAHLLIRERRPDAALGIVLRAVAGHTESVRAAAAKRPFEQLVAQVRRPPAWSMSGIGPLDRAVNTSEFFIHHEDVRRAQPEWQPRPLPPGLGRELWKRLPTAARLGLRRFPGRITLAADGYGELTAGSEGPPVRVAGDPGELTMFVSGRQPYARVEVTGDPELVARIQRRRFR